MFKRNRAKSWEEHSSNQGLWAADRDLARGTSTPNPHHPEKEKSRYDAWQTGYKNSKEFLMKNMKENYAIDSLMSGDTVSFKERIHDILAGKLADRIETEKVDVAERLFAGEEDGTEDYSDDSDSDDGEDSEDDSSYDADSDPPEELNEGFFHAKIKGHNMEKDAVAKHMRMVEKDQKQAGRKIVPDHMGKHHSLEDGGTTLVTRMRVPAPGDEGFEQRKHGGYYAWERDSVIKTRIRKSGKGHTLVHPDTPAYLTDA